MGGITRNTAGFKFRPNTRRHMESAVFVNSADQLADVVKYERIIAIFYAVHFYLDIARKTIQRLYVTYCDRRMRMIDSAEVRMFVIRTHQIE